MTENERLEELKDALIILVSVAEDNLRSVDFEELDNAGAEIIGCLEEIQQYRAIGTVEKFKAYKLGDCMNDCEHYDNCSNYIYSKGYSDGYAKALDEFAEALCEKASELSERCTFPGGLIMDVVTLDGISEIALEIAEQLKGVE